MVPSAVIAASVSNTALVIIRPGAESAELGRVEAVDVGFEAVAQRATLHRIGDRLGRDRLDHR